MRTWTFLVMLGTLPTFVSAAEPSKGAASAFEALAAVPQGVESLGVLKPSFTDGVLQSLIKAASVTRVSEDKLEMTHMRLNLKGDTEAGDVEVALTTAAYDVKSQMLTSDERSVVTRSDFVIEGDALVFDTGKSVGRMIGNVKMVIDLPAPEPSGSKEEKP
jgi:hypothetical protein